MAKGYTNAQWKRDQREQEQLDAQYQSVIDMAYKVAAVNTNFHGSYYEKEKGWQKFAASAREFVKLLEYHKRRDGILRLRNLPVGHEDRVFWYETGDGRGVQYKTKSKTLSLSKKRFAFHLGVFPKKREFTY